MVWFWQIFAPFWQYDFMRQALIALTALSLAAAPIGVFLLQRRMSLIGDAIAHAILPGSALGYLLFGFSITAMMVGGLLTGLIIAILSSIVSRTTKITEDASLASFYMLSLSLGVLIIASRGSNQDLLHILFGSVLALEQGALTALLFVMVFTLLVLYLIYRPLLISSFDRDFLSAMTPFGLWVDLVFLILAVINMVACFYLLGTLLAVGLMILPAAAVRYWSRDIVELMVLSMLFAVVGGAIGLLFSYHANYPPGPSIVLVLGCFYIGSVLFGRYYSFYRYWRHQKHLKQ